MICYVSAFLDLGRENWNSFSRSFEDYFRAFLPLTDLIEKENAKLVLFMDKRYSHRVRELNVKNIILVEIDREFMSEKSGLWKRIEREKEIVNSEFYKSLVSHRLTFPENTNAEYTMINHAKIDFVGMAVDMVEEEYFCWVDFGYFKNPESIPKRLLDIGKLSTNTVNYTLINPIDSFDSNIIYTLRFAPEKIGGFFFFGDRGSLLEYKKVYYDIHEKFQKMGIVDDDQHIVLQCYFNAPDLFTLHELGGWHRALTAFQASEEKAKPGVEKLGVEKQPILSLTEIMNKCGSDKGNGHHTYTEYYEKLFGERRDEKLDILEIGIGTNNPRILSSMCGTPGGYKPGASLRGWKEYFSNSNIYGCDIDREILFEEDRIKTFFVDQTSKDVLREQIVNKEQMYDIIVDDGLHRFAVNWFVFVEIFCKLKKGGYYIIEDICDFNDIVYTHSIMKEIEFKYIKIPNEKNLSDNNIVVIRRKGEYIPEL
jgi:hypothetical protein